MMLLACWDAWLGFFVALAVKEAHTRCMREMLEFSAIGMDGTWPEDEQHVQELWNVAYQRMNGRVTCSVPRGPIKCC